MFKQMKNILTKIENIKKLQNSQLIIIIENYKVKKDIIYKKLLLKKHHRFANFINSYSHR